MNLNSKQSKVLEDIFSKSKKSIIWTDIEKLMVALGAEIKEGSGSRGGFVFKNLDRTLLFHRPHPQKEAKDYKIKEIKNFLTDIGVKP